MIGLFGSIVFKASIKEARTFSNFQRDTTARWAVHEVHLKNPIAEFLGAGQDTISFDMTFDVAYGVKPRNELTSILVKCKEGTPHRLVIGGVPIGTKQWYIESITQTWDRFDGRGNLLRGGCTVTMKEYI